MDYAALSVAVDHLLDVANIKKICRSAKMLDTFRRNLCAILYSRYRVQINALSSSNLASVPVIHMDTANGTIDESVLRAATECGLKIGSSNLPTNLYLTIFVSQTSVGSLNGLGAETLPVANEEQLRERVRALNLIDDNRNQDEDPESVKMAKLHFADLLSSTTSSDSSYGKDFNKRSNFGEFDNLYAIPGAAKDDFVHFKNVNIDINDLVPEHIYSEQNPQSSPTPSSSTIPTESSSEKEARMQRMEIHRRRNMNEFLNDMASSSRAALNLSFNSNGPQFEQSQLTFSHSALPSSTTKSTSSTTSCSCSTDESCPICRVNRLQKDPALRARHNELKQKQKQKQKKKSTGKYARSQDSQDNASDDQTLRKQEQFAKKMENLSIVSSNDIDDDLESDRVTISASMNEVQMIAERQDPVRARYSQYESRPNIWRWLDAVEMPEEGELVNEQNDGGGIVDLNSMGNAEYLGPYWTDSFDADDWIEMRGGAALFSDEVEHPPGNREAGASGSRMN